MKQNKIFLSSLLATISACVISSAAQSHPRHPAAFGGDQRPTSDRPAGAAAIRQGVWLSEQ